MMPGRASVEWEFKNGDIVTVEELLGRAADVCVAMGHDEEALALVDLLAEINLRGLGPDDPRMRKYPVRSRLHAVIDMVMDDVERSTDDVDT